MIIDLVMFNLPTGRQGESEPESVLKLAVFGSGCQNRTQTRTHRGRSSVRYEIGLFAGDAPLSAALGQFTHVYVDRATRRPVNLPPALLAALQPLSPPP